MFLKFVFVLQKINFQKLSKKLKSIIHENISEF